MKEICTKQCMSFFFKFHRKAKLREEVLAIAAFLTTLLKFFLPAVTVTQYWWTKICDIFYNKTILALA